MQLAIRCDCGQTYSRCYDISDFSALYRGFRALKKRGFNFEYPARCSVQSGEIHICNKHAPGIRYMVVLNVGDKNHRIFF